MKIDAGGLLLFSIFVVFGSLVILYPFVLLALLVIALLLTFGYLAIRQMHRLGLENWQVILLMSLSGYIVLNYGFENLTIHLGGLPLIISYGLMFASLGLALASRKYLKVLREPVVYCLLCLILLTFLHLVVDVPAYGMWAVRDASMFLDGVFLFLGLCWALRPNSVIPLLRWLLVVFLLNMVYGLTFTWGETIKSLSPVSGVFLRVPILGFYHTTYIFLLMGALFFLFLAGYVVNWPRWIIFALALVQLGGLAIHQARSMYVGIVVTVMVLVVWGETRKSAKLLTVLGSGIIGLALLTGLGGVQLSGRVGPVNMDFFKEHIRSISGAEGTPGSPVQSRQDWTNEALEKLRPNPWFGVGFGLPLIDFVEESNGAATRQPHNSSVGILTRLGVTGFAIWVMFHLCLAKRVAYAFKHRRDGDRLMADLLLWLFILYVVFMLVMHVEPGLEFPSGSIPFYFFVGLFVGLIRWQLPATAEEPAPKPVYARPTVVSEFR